VAASGASGLGIRKGPGVKGRSGLVPAREGQPGKSSWNGSAKPSAGLSAAAVGERGATPRVHSRGAESRAATRRDSPSARLTPRRRWSTDWLGDGVSFFRSRKAHLLGFVARRGRSLWPCSLPGAVGCPPLLQALAPVRQHVPSLGLAGSNADEHRAPHRACSPGPRRGSPP